MTEILANAKTSTIPKKGKVTNMKSFLDENFLLETKTAQDLFHKYAKSMPIFDYHCHLNPKEIVEDKEFTDIAQMWLAGDHYKWRLMRNNGVDEYYITGNASGYEKFEKFIECLQYAVGNPLYHWCHLELQRYFNVYEVATKENVKKIWDKCNSVKFSPKKLIEMSDVAVVCTTDDPIDSLEYHKALKGYSTKILPTFRPDKSFKRGFVDYIKNLGDIKCFNDLINALEEKIKYFHEVGCRISDHALDYVPYGTCNPDEVLKKALSGAELSDCELDSYQTAVLTELAKLYKKYGWSMQLHIGVIRNNNAEMFAKLGPDTGFDSISDRPIAENLSKLLSGMGELPNTILYTLNPADNYVLGTMMGNFRNIRFGSAWWFCDQLDGMREQMKALANLGPLNKFLGMLTDSRSFLSYPRHEYFRRILCNLIGNWVENGEFPADEATLKTIVEGICYNNALEYFGI